MYLATASGPKVREAMSAGLLGQMMTPNAGNRVVDNVTWAADNGSFSSVTEFDPYAWVTWLESKDPDRCVFAAVPDVVGSHEATRERWDRYVGHVTSLGYPPAFVVQDGCAPDEIPADCESVFIGGSTDWKLGAEAAACAAWALRNGKWLHMGRVNSRKRVRYARELGCHSVDGTYLAFGPDKNLPKLLSWMEENERETE